MKEISNSLDCMHDQQAILYRSAYGADEPGLQRTGCHERNAYYRGGGQPLPEDRKYCVRRLTPLECCRLQGFPDWWEEGVEGSDSARYKMWGNGMALPCVLYVMEGIQEVLSE